MIIKNFLHFMNRFVVVSSKTKKSSTKIMISFSLMGRHYYQLITNKELFYQWGFRPSPTDS